MAAHFLRSGSIVLIGLVLLSPAILLIRRMWALRMMQVLLVLWALEWLLTALAIAQRRMEAGEAWLRMALILGAVVALNLLAAWLLQRRRFQDRYRRASLPADAN